MATTRPDKRLSIRRYWPRAVAVYQINELDDADTIELADFDPGENIETATIVNADDGATVTQGAISNNVLTVNDATMADSRVWIFIVGLMAP